jgi:uncharacterized protein YerC
MPRVSKAKLNHEIEQAMFKQFWSSVAKINDVSKASEFFSDLLTETEEKMLSKRLAAAILLVRGKTATDIKNSIHLTYTTIGSVASWVKNAKPKTKEILLSFSKEKDWEEIVDKIESILDKLPPRHGTSWSESGKRKSQRAKKRSNKKTLNNPIPASATNNTSMYCWYKELIRTLHNHYPHHHL